MSDLVPVQPAQTALAATAKADTDSWIQVAGDVIRLAEHIADTAFVPKGLRGNVPATAAAMLYGREVGLPPMTALSQTHVIEGKPSVSAEAMRAMVLAAGHELETTETTGAVCIMRGRRRGGQGWTTIQWTIDMARAAGLMGKDNWRKYPRSMLQARATAELARLVFPDVIHGFSAMEELDEDGEPGDVPAASPGTSVRRTRKPAAAKPAAAPDAPPAPVDEDAPPLPGDEPAPETPGAAPVARTTAPGQDGEEAPSHTSSPSTDPEPVVVEEPAPAPRPATGGQPASQAQLRMIFGALKSAEVDDNDAERHYVVGRLAGRPITSFKDLTKNDASQVIDTLARFPTKNELWAFLDSLDQGALAIDEPES